MISLNFCKFLIHLFQSCKLIMGFFSLNLLEFLLSLLCCTLISCTRINGMRATPISAGRLPLATYSVASFGSVFSWSLSQVLFVHVFTCLYQFCISVGEGAILSFPTVIWFTAITIWWISWLALLLWSLSWDQCVGVRTVGAKIPLWAERGIQRRTTNWAILTGKPLMDSGYLWTLSVSRGSWRYWANLVHNTRTRPGFLICRILLVRCQSCNSWNARTKTAAFQPSISPLEADSSLIPMDLPQ